MRSLGFLEMCLFIKFVFLGFGRAFAISYLGFHMYVNLYLFFLFLLLVFTKELQFTRRKQESLKRNTRLGKP